jgi:hypothetical protein
MTPRHSRSAKERKADDRRIFRISLAISVLAHCLIFAFWTVEPPLVSPFAAAGPRSGDPRAAAGSMQGLNLRVVPSRPIVPPRIPLPTVDVEPVEIQMEDPSMDAVEALGERPGAEAPGIEGGEGEGDGGTGEEGLFRLIPPAPRGMIMPPTNERLRGQQIQVWVFVNEYGRVVPDSTRLRPPTSDRGFNRRLIEEAAEWIFEPARQDGRAVASWFPYTISM